MTVTKRLQNAPDTLEQGVVKSFAVKQTEMVQCLGNGKYYMEVFYIQSIADPLVDPNRLFVKLAFRAMAVAATVVTESLFSATIATIFMSSQSRCSAFEQSVKGSHCKAIGLALRHKL